MPNSGENVRLQLSVNGKVVATVGIDSFGVLSAIVTWVKRNPAKFKDRYKPDPADTLEGWISNRVSDSIGGLNSVSEKRLDWFRREIVVGEEVTIRVLPPGAFDLPIPRRRPVLGPRKRRRAKTSTTRRRR